MDKALDKTYKCDSCGQDFKRLYNLQRHQRTKHWKNERVLAVCDTCGKMFSRMDNMRQHQQKCHIQPEKSTQSSDQEYTGHDQENVNDSSRAGDRKRQRDHNVEKTSPCKKFATSLENDVPVDVVDELIDNPELLKVYRTNWRQIRPSVKKGKILSKYNCFLPTLENVNLANCAEGVFAMQTNAFKINAAFGFILVNSETNERRYYYSSGNTKIFVSPFLVKDRASFETFYKALEEIDALEYARLQRPNSKWMVEAVCNLTFFVYKIRDHPIGACSDLPEYILKNQAIVSLISSPSSNKPYKDNLCIFRCIALHKGTHRCMLEKKTKAMLKEYTSQNPKDFAGVKLDQLHQLEDLFQVNIVVYELVELEDDFDNHLDEAEKQVDEAVVVARLVRRSLGKHGTTMYINLYDNHFSYISNLERYTHSYSCRKCHKMWKTNKQLQRHEATCECKGECFG